MAHFLCHLGCSHFGALLLDFYFTENICKDFFVVKHSSICPMESTPFFIYPFHYIKRTRIKKVAVISTLS